MASQGEEAAAAANGPTGGGTPAVPAVGFAGAADQDVSKLKNPFDPYYAQLIHQQNMLQDSMRTGTYRNAITENAQDFKGKVVLDVGAGSGILSFFAAFAGARKVYAVEASDIADAARTLVQANGYGGIIEVVKGKLEEIELPEKVDVIVSEPIGFLLVHERMLETYIKARDKFLKPGGKMFPAVGEIVVAPLTADQLYQEQLLKAGFWDCTNFYGVDLTGLQARAVDEHFAQPVVGYFYANSLISEQRTRYTVDFREAKVEELIEFEIPFSFVINRTAIMHGLGCWFDIMFHGSQATLILSTAPECPGTHWYQCRLLFKDPIAVNNTQVVRGTMKFVANDKFSYNITVTAALDGTNITTSQRINLQDQSYQYLQQQAHTGGE